MNFLKRITLMIMLGLLMLSSALVYARITHTLLVEDSLDSTELPESFRTSSDALPDSTEINKTGLEQLHIAGSHQFSKSSFLSTLTHFSNQPIVVVDLRRESHGLLNDDAVSWYGPQNAANLNKAIPQIAASEARLLKRLNQSSYRWVYQIVSKTDDDYIDKVERNFEPIHQAQSEQQFLQQHHVGYQRYYVEDFHAPSAEEATRFVKFANNVSGNTWLYFHCRAGKGRTTTFMAMYDMMKNAKQVSLDDILARQAALGGADLRDLPDNQNFKYPFAVERLQFLHSFYDYAKSNNDHFATSYVEWKKSHAR